ncbi:MAG: hypothetical protein QXP80_00940 [Zestosphaera sp.]
MLVLKRERIIKELTGMVDESDDVWMKVAFYSDEKVQELLDILYVRWSNAGYDKTPLDHATDDELRELYDRATRIRKEDKDKAALNMCRRMSLSSSEED